jgi:hypothetical protein
MCCSVGSPGVNREHSLAVLRVGWIQCLKTDLENQEIWAEKLVLGTQLFDLGMGLLATASGLFSEMDRSNSAASNR